MARAIGTMLFFSPALISTPIYAPQLVKSTD
jgi:hypothetical protein